MGGLDAVSISNGGPLLVGRVCESLARHADAAECSHPFSVLPSRGATTRDVLDRAERLLDAPPTLTQSFVSSECAVSFWTARHEGAVIEGATAAAATSQDVELRIALRNAGAAERWWSRMQQPGLGNLLPSNRECTQVHAPPSVRAQPVDPSLPELADEVEFRAPILDRPVRGAAQVREVVGHASAVYGARRMGPRVTSGRDTALLWTVWVQGRRIEQVGLMRADAAGRLTSLAAYMTPWPHMALFRQLMLQRLDPALF